jgi:hypothetical protein
MASDRVRSSRGHIRTSHDLIAISKASIANSRAAIRSSYRLMGREPLGVKCYRCGHEFDRRDNLSAVGEHLVHFRCESGWEMNRRAALSIT